MLAIAASTIFVACKKDEVKTTESGKTIAGLKNCNARLINDYFAFDSVQDMNNYVVYLETHSTEQINQLEQTNGFLSYDRHVEQILRGYELLNEDSTTTMQQILAFRTQHQNYLTITDEDFFLKIEGISNRVVNKDGYLQIGNDFFKYVGKTIYRTKVENKQLLYDANYTNNLVTKTEMQELQPNGVGGAGLKTTAVNQWGNKKHETRLHCDRFHQTNIEVKFYAQGPSMPAYGATGLVYCSAGFNYYLKNMKRGWTGVWYGQARASTNTGTFHSSYNGYTTFSHPDNSITVNRIYNSKTWTKTWDQSPENAVYWANEKFSTLWAYVAGTVYFDVCGSRNWAY